MQTKYIYKFSFCITQVSLEYMKIIFKAIIEKKNQMFATLGYVQICQIKLNNGWILLHNKEHNQRRRKTSESWRQSVEIQQFFLFLLRAISNQ